MTAIDQTLSPHRALESPATHFPPPVDPKGPLLEAVFEVFDRDGLAYCVLHGYETYPRQVPSDVDLLVPREMVPRRLSELLRANEAALGGAKIVQWFEERAN